MHRFAKSDFTVFSLNSIWRIDSAELNLAGYHQRSSRIKLRSRISQASQVNLEVEQLVSADKIYAGESRSDSQFRRQSSSEVINYD